MVVIDHTLTAPSFTLKVMVVGPMDSGKTSLCKILLNYGVKACRKMLFVDIDPNEVSATLTA